MLIPANKLRLNNRAFFSGSKSLLSHPMRMFNTALSGDSFEKIYAINFKSGNVDMEWSLGIHDSAVERIDFLRSKDPEKYKYLRILVEGGGCAGF